MTITVRTDQSFDVEECIECGCVFAITTQFKQKRIEDHKVFHCPNGHGQVYGDGPIEKLKRQLAFAEKEKQRLAAQKDQVAAELRDTEKRLTAQRGQTTIARNKLARVKAGVCPCCDAPFPDLQKHIAAEHPEFTPEKPEDAADGDEGKAGTSEAAAETKTETSEV